MMPYTERFDDFEILTLRFTILRNCPSLYGIGIQITIHPKGEQVKHHISKATCFYEIWLKNTLDAIQVIEATIEPLK